MRGLLAAVFAFSGVPALGGPAPDGDVRITSASRTDGVWSVAVFDSATGECAVFEVGRVKKRGSIGLVSFDEKNCTAFVDTPRGRLFVALAKPGDWRGGHVSELSEAIGAEEAVAASNGKVTPRHRASLWKHSGH